MLEQLRNEIGKRKVLLLTTPNSLSRKIKLYKINRRILSLIKKEAKKQSKQMYKITMDTYTSIIKSNFC